MTMGYKFAALNNVNVDILHIISADDLTTCIEHFRKRYKASDEVLRRIELAKRYAFGEGGEVAIDGYRDEFERFNDSLGLHADDTIFTLGGNAGNAAAALANIGEVVYLSGAIRDDARGKWLRDFLAENKTRLTYMNVKEATKPQATTFGLELKGHDRAFLDDGNDNRYLQVSEQFRSACFKNEFDCILVLGIHVLRHDFQKLYRFVKAVKERTDSVVIVDSGDFTECPVHAKPTASELFGLADVACFNENELLQFGRSAFIPDAARRMARDLGNTVCVHATHYALCADNDEMVAQPTFDPGRIVLRTGLGDCFVAGFASGYLRKRASDTITRLKYGLRTGVGCAVARLETGGYGSMADVKREREPDRIGVKFVEGLV